MTQEEANLEAVKREKNKSKHMTNKKWVAKHSEEKGWHVALVDNQEELHRQALQDARSSFQRGDMQGFMNAAFEGVMARARMDLEKE